MGVETSINDLRPLLTAIKDAVDNISVAISPGDVEIGAVEIKNGATDDRAEVVNADAAAASTQFALLVRTVGLLGTLGEVQASPTANTVLDRLKALLTSIVLAAGAGSGGIPSCARLLSAAASTNGTNAKASAGRVYAIQGYNAAVSTRYLKLYNKATSPTVGTDTPVKTLALPAGAAFAFDWPLGFSFGTGIGYGLTTGSADNDTGALTAGDILGLNIDYA